MILEGIVDWQVLDWRTADLQGWIEWALIPFSLHVVSPTIVPSPSAQQEEKNWLRSVRLDDPMVMS